VSWSLELTLENEGDALPEDKDRSFEAFVTSEKSTDNLGLGLFVAQSIALNHGGDIVAEDLPRDRGARFVVRLPEACENARAVDVEDASLAPAWRARLDEDQPPQ
jgi:signal transduction histidine kinase